MSAFVRAREACLMYNIQSWRCQPGGEDELNLSHGLQISLCLLLRVKYVISYLRSVKAPKREGGFLPFMCNLLKMDLHV